MDKFLAFRSFEESGKISTRFVENTLDDISPGEVVIRALYSSVNYKDALGATGKGRIYKNTPIVGGIDVAGTVESSENRDFSPGQNVLVTGCGLGESHDGGFSQYVRVPASWVVPIPKGLSCFEAMSLGTAGFTAAICVDRMQINGQKPQMGPIAVTGASGGVGSIAVSIFSQLGYEVTAISSKTDQHDFLKTLGASETVSAKDLELGSRPLEKSRFGGVVDNVGGELLAKLAASVSLFGNVACVGLAASHELKTTVMPLILRGVSFLGASSMNTPMPKRKELWKHLATDWKPKNLEDIVKRVVEFRDIEQTFSDMIDRKTFGRIVVKIQE